MKKLSVFAALMALFGGTAAMVDSAQRETLPAPSSNMLTSSAAFRDGWYFGRYTARRGGLPHVVTGRWATAADRDLFADGYQQGYRELQASRASRTRSAW